MHSRSQVNYKHIAWQFVGP